MDDYLTRLSEAIRAFSPSTVVETVDKRLDVLITLILECFMKGRRETIGERIFIRKHFSFWSFLAEFSAPNTIEEILLLPALNPFYESQGRKIQAWVISSLNQGDFYMYLTMFQGNAKFIKTHYSKNKESFFTIDGFLDKLIPLIVEMEDSLKFNIDFDDYANYFDPERETSKELNPFMSENEKESNKSSVSLNAAIVTYGEGHLVSPVPFIESNSGILEVPTPKSVNLSSLDVKDNVSLRNSTKDSSTSSSKSLSSYSDVDTFEMEPVEKVYISEFRQFIDINEQQLMEEKCEITDYDGPSILMPLTTSSEVNSSSTTSIILEDMMPASVEVIPIGQNGEDKEEENNINIEEMDSAKAELSNIFERPRSAKITIVNDGNFKAFVPYPPLVPSPSTDPGHVIDHMGSPFYSSESHASAGSELGFFGIPISIKSLTRNFRPFGKLIKEISQVDLFNNDTENTIANSPKQDQFEFDTVMPIFNPISNVCRQCHKDLTRKEVSKVCDISRKVYCLDCFDEVKLESPARILNNWDFNTQSVHRETHQLYFPQFGKKLINLENEFPLISERVPELKEIKETRQSILKALNHVSQCPSNIYSQVQSKFRFFPHLINTTELFTIQDLIDVNNGVVTPLLKAIFHKLDNHITSSCALCQRYGPKCGVCHDESNPLYEHRKDLFNECKICGFKAHPNCWSSEDDCPSCNRVHVSLDSPSIDLAITPNS